MDAYIFQAALWCEACAHVIMQRLKDEDHAPADPSDEYSFDSDDYPKGPFADGGGEADYEQYCDGCNCALGNPIIDA